MEINLGYTSIQSGRTYRSTKRPYVDRNCPSCIEHDFRCTIYRRPYDVLSIVCRYTLWNGITEVFKLNTAESRTASTVIGEDVIRFDICSQWL